jgi:hypothetical protein
MIAIIVAVGCRSHTSVDQLPSNLTTFSVVNGQGHVGPAMSPVQRQESGTDT